MPLLNEGTVEHAGEVYRVNNTFGPLERMGTTPPKVVVAALGEIMLKLAGRMTDGTATWMTGHQTLESHIIPTISKAAADAGRGAPMVIAGAELSVISGAAHGLMIEAANAFNERVLGFLARVPRAETIEAA
jgi:alkanesulfonate monooxygenase SsuD/methylene tetrahydromethanopterin reductase-like flavin-dependent oxidoreductase (luciferase family)